jgi:hypothetical protein
MIGRFQVLGNTVSSPGPKNLLRFRTSPLRAYLEMRLRLPQLKRAFYDFKLKDLPMTVAEIYSELEDSRRYRDRIQFIKHLSLPLMAKLSAEDPEGEQLKFGT